LHAGGSRFVAARALVALSICSGAVCGVEREIDPDASTPPNAPAKARRAPPETVDANGAEIVGGRMARAAPLVERIEGAYDALPCVSALSLFAWALKTLRRWFASRGVLSMAPSLPAPGSIISIGVAVVSPTREAHGTIPIDWSIESAFRSQIASIH